MIDRGHDLPITKQAEVLRIRRGSIYYLWPRGARSAAVSPTLIMSCQLVRNSHRGN